MNTEKRKNVYVGHRYVPKMMGEWEQTESYEGLSVVTYQGASYTSKKRVPKGIDILNTEYWVITGNYNAQVDGYRNEVRQFQDDLITTKNEIINDVDDKLDIFENSITNDLITTKNEIINDVDDKIDVFENSITNDFIDFKEVIETDIESLENKVELVDENLNNKVNSPYINAKYPPAGYVPAKGDGVTDDLEAIQTLINNFDYVVLPKGVYAVSDTIYLGSRYKKLEGSGIVTGRGGHTVSIKYIGEKNNKKAVIVHGQSDPGNEPVIDSSGNTLKNLVVDGNNKAGFGVYGTYLTNESVVSNVIAINTLEYGMYFARSWYAKFTDLLAAFNRNVGLAFGMPLVLLDGTEYEWSTSASLEMNNTQIMNVRSKNAGEYYSQEHQNSFNPRNKSHQLKGYGIGFGLGNGFVARDFLSESSGGINLISYTDTQPVKSISNGYLEKTNLNSGLDSASELVNLLILSVGSTGRSITISDIFMNYKSGGILHSGDKRVHLLKNIQQPRFLQSTDYSDIELYSFVLKENVYYEAGFYNSDPKRGVPIASKKINTKNTWELDLPAGFGGRYLLMVKGDSTKSSVRVITESGSESTFSFSSLPSSDYVLQRGFTSEAVKIQNSGSLDNTDKEIFIRVIAMPDTDFS